MSDAVKDRDERKLSDVRLYGDVSGREREARVALELLRPKDDSDEAKVREAETRLHLEQEIAGYEEARKRMAAELHKQMVELGIETAQDMIDLGCTGLAAKGCGTSKISHIRLAFGGSGVPIPCYVGPDRYCHAHGSIGGLQDGQAPRHPEMVATISRELEGKEKAHMELVNAARHTRGGARGMDAIEHLSGRKLPEGMDIVEDEEVDAQDGEGAFLQEPVPSAQPQVDPEAMAAMVNVDVTTAAGRDSVAEVLKIMGYALRYGAGPDALEGMLKELSQHYPLPADSVLTLQLLIERASEVKDGPFKCEEHVKPDWGCRYCVAASVVDGALEPKLLLLPAIEGNRAMMEDAIELESPADMAETMHNLHEKGVEAVGLYVKVTAWRQQFTRDGEAG